MRWVKHVIGLICLLLGGVGLLWYGAAWINGGDFRKYLILNAVVVCSLCLTLFVLRFLTLRIARWVTGNMSRWLRLWAGLGLLLPVPIFFLDRLAPFYTEEHFLFALWPSYMILMIPGSSWGGFLILMPLSMIVNGTIYAGLSALVWGLLSPLRRLPGS